METNDSTPQVSVYPSRSQLTEMEPGEIRKEIELTLAEIDSTIDQLKEAASPQALRTKAVAGVKRRMGDAVGEALRATGERTYRLGATVATGMRRNPAPVAIVSAGVLLAGVAFAWRRHALRAMRPAPRSASEVLRCWLQGL